MCSKAGLLNEAYNFMSQESENVIMDFQHGILSVSSKFREKQNELYITELVGIVM